MSNAAKALIASIVMIVSSLYMEAWLWNKPIEPVQWWIMPTVVLFFVVGIFGIGLFCAVMDMD